MTTQSHYTVLEVAKIFKYDPQSIRMMIRKGRIFAFRLGKGNKSPYRIKREEVERLIEIGFDEQMEILKETLHSKG